MERHGIVSVATPAISTGVFGYPLEEVADIALRTVVQAAQALWLVRLVRFVPWDRDARVVHEAALEHWAGGLT